MITLGQYEAREFLNKIVRIYDYQQKGGDLFGCQGQPMDGYSALANYNEIAKSIKEFIDGEKEKVIEKDNNDRRFRI